MARSLNQLSTGVGLRIAHISDLHFGHFTLSPTQFFSKRFVGNFHLALHRWREFAPRRLYHHFARALVSQNVDLVVITGDLTTTTHKKELGLALDFFHELEEAGLCVLALPGNHDHYTSRAFREKHFYDYFTNDLSPSKRSGSLETERLEIYPIARGLWLIALDTALSTSLLCAQGFFPEALEMRLEKLLSDLPPTDSVILCNHYPYIDIEQDPRHALKRGEALEALLRRHSSVVLYLHGHTHRHTLADLRETGLPITLDAGSVSLRENPTYNLIDATRDGCEITAMRGVWEGNHMRWESFKEERLLF